MKIYGSTQYVDPATNGEWYQVDVISQWDWSTKAICFKILGKQLIPYCFRKHVATSPRSSQTTLIEAPTEEMKKELISMGYIINTNLTTSKK